MRTLVLGGIRSGKSRWAEVAMAAATGPREPVCYLATGAADPSDTRWSRRIAAHADRRPRHWNTVETHCLSTYLRSSTAATLIDDLGGWLTAAMDRHRAWENADGEALASDVDDLIAAIGGFAAPLIVVSPEVGLTVVPATPAGRLFADELGQLNQGTAAVCDRVVLVVAGQPVPVKEPAR